MPRFFVVFLVAMLYFKNCFAQEKVSDTIFKNQVSSNIPYLVLGSLNISYERTLSKYFAIGISGVSYGSTHKKFHLSTTGIDYSSLYEVNPFGRWYMQNTQRNSLFLEVFGSFNASQNGNNIVRINNAQGYGVYTYEIEENDNFGAGIGFGYRLLLVGKKLVLEAQFGLRTNFEFNFFFFDAEIVRTGLRVGYRF